jgi:hypothetical protein
MNYSWKKASQRAPLSIKKTGLENDRVVFKNLINKLTQAKFLIVYMDECSFNSSALPLYTWIPKGNKNYNVIRPTNQRYNCIAARWNNEVYFHIKQGTSKQEDFIEFLKKLKEELKFRESKNMYEKGTIFMMDNARIHKTKDIK